MIYLSKVTSDTEVFSLYLYKWIFMIMSYEAGSKECRNLIDAKESLLSAMESLSEIRDTENLQLLIKDIYNTLEKMHDNRRDLESNTKVNKLN